MNWPMSQDFNEAIQNPVLVFSDPDLKAGETVVGARGLPLPRSGNFADVYQMRGADGRNWAVKCFTRPVVGLAERYARVDEALAQANLPFTVKFAFLGEGIRVGGAWRPVVKMEWVEGLLFNQVVKEKANQPAILSALGQMWGRMCKRLRESGIAHTDIQHGNVMLVPGSRPGAYGLKLIDYDGMFVPALANSPSGESGHAAYQHPTRVSGRIYSADLDRFPNVVIATVLKGLEVAGPALWEKYDTGDNLLFVEDDFKSPSTSKLMRELWQTGQEAVQGLVGRLAIACGKPIPQTPWLDQFAPNGEPAPLDNEMRREAAEALGIAIPVAVGIPPESLTSAGASTEPSFNFEPVPDSPPEATREDNKKSHPAKKSARTKKPQRKAEQGPKSGNRMILFAGGAVILIIGAAVGAVAFSGGKKPPANSSQVEEPKNLEPNDSSVKATKIGGTKGKETEPVKNTDVTTVPSKIEPPKGENATANGIGISPIANQHFTFNERKSVAYTGQNVSRVHFREDGRRLIALNVRDGTLFTCDTMSNQAEEVRKFQPPPVLPEFHMLPNDEVVVWSPSDYSVLLIENATRKMRFLVPPAVLPAGAPAKYADFNVSPDHRYVAAGIRGANFRLIDLSTGKELLQFDWKLGWIHFTADSSRVLIVEYTGIGRWFKLPSGDPDGEWIYNPQNTGSVPLRVEQASLVHGLLLGISEPRGGLGLRLPVILDANTGLTKVTLGKNRNVVRARLSSDGKFVVVLEPWQGDNPGSLVVYDVATGAAVGRAPTPKGTVDSELDLSPQDKSVLIVVADSATGSRMVPYDLLKSSGAFVVDPLPKDVNPVSPPAKTVRDLDPRDREMIDKAREAYNAETAKIREEVIVLINKRKEKARETGKKKLVDEIEAQREEFELQTFSPIWPADLPADLSTRINKSQSQFEAVCENVIEECLKTKKNLQAAQVERELAYFRASVHWQLLDIVELNRAEVKDGYFRIPPNAEIHSRKSYKGGFEVKLVARTENENIRLHAHNGSTVIWNWESKPTELRVHRPDGKMERIESGSIARANVAPLMPNTYYTLKWTMTSKGITVSTNGQVVFSETRSYNLDTPSKISIMTKRSKVDVKEFTITPIPDK